MVEVQFNSNADDPVCHHDEPSRFPVVVPMQDNQFKGCGCLLRLHPLLVGVVRSVLCSVLHEAKEVQGKEKLKGVSLLQFFFANM